MMNISPELQKVFIIITMVFVFLSLVVMEMQGHRIDNYEDTVAEYVMCIKYNTDGDCSDIILSEYGEEVE